MQDQEKSEARDRRQPGRSSTNSLWAGRSKVDPAPPSLNAQTLPALFVAQALERRFLPFARCRHFESLAWEVVSWNRTAHEVLLLANLLKERCGVKPGDRVAIVSSTRYEWIVADLAILSIGAVSVAVYHSLTSADSGFVLWDSDAQVVFAENEEQVRKICEISKDPFEVPQTEYAPAGQITYSVRHIISFEALSAQVDCASLHLYHDVCSAEARASLSDDSTFDSLRQISQHVKATDLASIVYTSGTTGAPKGVAQTHDNHVAMLDSVMLSGLVGRGEGVFLYLPLAHSFARLIAYAVVSSGGDLIFSAVTDRKKSKFQPTQILRDLSDSDPLIFPSVPRLFEKVMEGLSQPKVFKEKVAKWAVDVTADARRGTLGTGFVAKQKLKLASRIIPRVREKVFGKKLLYCISGGAPISVEALEFFQDLGVLICEGYGLTETTPAMAANIPNQMKFGTVGRLFECNEVRIAPFDGEIEVRGRNVASGYWKCPKATADAWDAEGWFKTGDIGEIDEEGFLKITDRKKDIIVLAGGKKVPPAYIEGKLKNSGFISNALVFGERRPYLIALLTLNEANVRAALEEQGHTLPPGGQAIAQDPNVRALLSAEVSRMNAKLASFEQIKRFEALAEDFTLENGLLTPSLKLKRRLVIERFSAQIDAVYARPGLE
ncbi:MAG: long-chain fatty acid--CoA ligase [Deltaproteobacteria bacterium]|nr:long-chain fatty acid--CoA ligase [Deltaproteobacteria bacterium]